MGKREEEEDAAEGLEEEDAGFPLLNVRYL